MGTGRRPRALADVAVSAASRYRKRHSVVTAPPAVHFPTSRQVFQVSVLSKLLSGGNNE